MLPNVPTKEPRLSLAVEYEQPDPLEPIPTFGGSLDFNGEGMAGCVRCGWRGVPTYLGGEVVRVRLQSELGPPQGTVAGAYASTFCPACESGEEEPEPGLPTNHWKPVIDAQIAAIERTIGRNEPCWCGSGKKFKKCHGR